jgi:hypothetical protein
MNDTQNETTLADVRLHWGIYVPALVLVVFLLLGTLPFLFVLKIMGNFASQLNAPMAHPNAALWFVLVPDFILCAGVLLGAWASRVNSKIRLTSRRLIFNNVLAANLTGELPLENVEGIFIYTPFWGMLCSYGTVTVTSIGGDTFPMRFIGSPQTFQATLQRAIANAKAPSKPAFNLPPPSADDKAVLYPPITPANDNSRFMPKG